MTETDPALVKLRASIMRAGSVSVFTSEEDVCNAVMTFLEAREQGHAMTYDETFDSGRKFVCAHVLHYRSCLRCKEEGNVH